MLSLFKIVDKIGTLKLQNLAKEEVSTKKNFPKKKVCPLKNNGKI